MRHILAICPAANLAAANAALDAAGHGAGNFAIQLVARTDRDNATPTHHACGLSPVYERQFRSALSGLPVVFIDGDISLNDWSGALLTKESLKSRASTATREVR